MTVYRFERLLPYQLTARLAERPLLVVPFGTIEWHSDHAPLGLDGLVAAATCERVAGLLDAVLAPVSYSAVNGIAFPYTLKLPIEVVEPLVSGMLIQFAAMGFRVIVAFTGHFPVEQLLMLKRAALHVMESTPATVLAVAGYELISDHWQGDHAAVGETSMLWAVHPDLVELDRLPERPDGILGDDPRAGAGPQHGEEMIARISDNVAVLTARLFDASAVERSDFMEATRAGVRALAKNAELRLTRPKSSVPPLTTPSWLTYLSAVAEGRFREARVAADAKLLELVNL